MVALRHAEGAFAVGAPLPDLRFAGTPADHLHSVGHHEGGVEADAELADLRDVAAGLVELFDEGGSARLGDGSQILDQLLAIHPDPVVGDAEPPRGLVHGQADSELRIVGDELGVGDRLIPQAVAGVRGVRDQLAQEYLLVRVE